MIRRRAGMGLIEVMLAIAIATGVVGVLGVTVSRMFAANATAREHAHTMNALGQFGSQFRRDAHGALSTSLEPPAERTQVLAFATPGNDEIQYEIVPGGIERRLVSGGQPRARELFLMQGMKPIGWQLDEQHREVVLTIGRLARPSADDNTLSGQFSIRASQRPASVVLKP